MSDGFPKKMMAMPEVIAFHRFMQSQFTMHKDGLQ